MIETTASGALYIAANCAAGLKRSILSEDVEPKKIRTRMLQFVDPNVNPYINGNFDFSPELKGLVAGNATKGFPAKLTTVDLHNSRINRIDQEFLEFSNIEELSLSGNLLCRVDNQNLPSSIRILHLNGNKLDSLPSLGNLTKLVHLGLSYNAIRSLPHDLEVTSFLSAGITSLDLSFNSITDLLGTASSLRNLSSLKNLALFGNPICLLSSYPSEVLKRLPKLAILDEKHSKTIDYSSPEYTDIVSLNVHVQNILNFKKPAKDVSSPDVKEEFSYSVKVSLDGQTFETPDRNEQDGTVSLDFSGALSFPIEAHLTEKMQTGLLLTIQQSRYSISLLKKDPSVPGMATDKKGGGKEKAKKGKEDPLLQTVRALIEVKPIKSELFSLDELTKGEKSLSRSVQFGGDGSVLIRVAVV